MLKLKKSFWYSAAAIAVLGATGILTTTARVQAGPEEDCAAAKKRVSWLPSLFKEGGRCFGLPEDQMVSIRSTSYAAALENFKTVKANWLDNFDAKAEDSLGAKLVSIQSLAKDTISAHPERKELNEKLQAAVKKIDTLNAKVDALRPNGGTTYSAISAIDHALGDLQDTCTDSRDSVYGYPYCPGAGKGGLEQLDKALQDSSDQDLAKLKDKVHGFVSSDAISDVSGGLDGLRTILLCRINDDQLARDRKTAQACDAASAKKPEASTAKSSDFFDDLVKYGKIAACALKGIACEDAINALKASSVTRKAQPAKPSSDGQTVASTQSDADSGSADAGTKKE